MIAAVILDCQALVPVNEVCTRNESALGVTNRKLSLGPRKAGKHKQHPEPRFHRRLGLWFHQIEHTAKARDTTGSGMGSDMGSQSGERDESRMERHVRGNHALNQWISGGKVDHHAES